MKRVILSTLAILLGSSVALADREVTVLPVLDKVKLVNPSSVDLNIDISCKAGDGSDSHVINSTLQAQNTASHFVGQVDNVACKYSSKATHLNGMERCGSNGDVAIDHSQAADTCGANFHVCSLTEYNSNRGGDPTVFWAWLDWSGGFAFTSSYPSWSSYSTPTTFPASDSFSTWMCNTDAAGTGTDINYCSQHSATSTTANGVMCCPDSWPLPPVSAKASFCKVKVQGNDGYIISPQFKGGTPF